MDNSTVMVTGGAGFIGCELVRQLLDGGASVRVVDSLVNGKRRNLDGLPPDRLSLAVVDVRDGARMAALLDGVDVVYHLACLGVRHSIKAPEENHQVNASATLGLLELCRQKKVSRFVYVSSSEVYGTAQAVSIDESHPTLPHTVYGASKLAGECYARAYHLSYGLPTVMVRPFNAFGPRCHHEGDSGEVIPRFMLRCLAGQPMVVFGDGDQTRDFTYVADTARGILLAGVADAAIGRTFNLGSGKEISINALAAQVAKAAGRPNAPIEHHDPRPADVRRLCADTREAERLLGFKCAVGLHEGLARLRSWYESHDQSIEEMLNQEVLYNWRSESDG